MGSLGRVEGAPLTEVALGELPPLYGSVDKRQDNFSNRLVHPWTYNKGHFDPWKENNYSVSYNYVG